jgi:hypothetical protein
VMRYASAKTRVQTLSDKMLSPMVARDAKKTSNDAGTVLNQQDAGFLATGKPVCLTWSFLDSSILLGRLTRWFGTDNRSSSTVCDAHALGVFKVGHTPHAFDMLPPKEARKNAMVYARHAFRWRSNANAQKCAFAREWRACSSSISRADFERLPGGFFRARVAKSPLGLYRVIFLITPKGSERCRVTRSNKSRASPEFICVRANSGRCSKLH